MIAELRAFIAARPLEHRAYLATAGVTFVGVLVLPPAAFVWLLVAYLMAGCALLGHRLLEVRGELATAYEALNGVLDEHALCPAPVRPLLRVVPTSEEVAAAEWPAIMRAVEGEIGGAS